VVVVGEKKKQSKTEPIEEKSGPPNPSEEEPELDTKGVLEKANEELAREKTKSDDYLRRLQYLQADFENYRKRVEKEMFDNRQYGNQRLLSDLVVVNDELELAVRRAEESGEAPTITEGLKMVNKRLQGLLSKEGVEKIQSLGTKFNPDLHEAALREASNEEDGTIIEEIRPGYMLKGKVLRPSIVKVAAGPAEPESKSEKGSIEEVGDKE